MVKTKRTDDLEDNIKTSTISFVIFTIGYIIFLMWLYGTVNHYFHSVHIGFGQYLDPAVAIIVIGIGIYTYLAALLVRYARKKKKAS
jgi:cadmium resistance protein CadD (predicted permease)